MTSGRRERDIDQRKQQTVTEVDGEKLTDQERPGDALEASAAAPAEETAERPPLTLRRLRRRIKRRVKKRIKHAVNSLEKRSPRARRVSRALISAKRRFNYRGHLRREVVDEKLVIFESFMGRSYSCSPKALYLAMLNDARFDDFRFVWAFKNPHDYEAHPDLKRAELVRHGSQEYYRRYARAKYWFTNSRIPGHIERKPEQVYVQAWHGTPLKRLGCDIVQSDNALNSTEDLHQLYRHEGARATHVLSPSRFASEKFASAFDLVSSGREDIIIEEGYPRNDYLLACTEEDIARLRAELEIPPGKKTVLYAPTWRDNQHVSGVGYVYDPEADFDRLYEDLGDEWVILFRAHYFIANEFDFDKYGGFVRDVSAVDDINELYAASDILVTDYSSVFFDYANLQRPIIFYMYDLEHYAEDIRGFYLDLDELPGPIVRTEPELVEALLAADTRNEEIEERYRRFNERFTCWDDGEASARVLDRIFGK
jgi:CDP-glycerol glycerophosphotransferase